MTVVKKSIGAKMVCAKRFETNIEGDAEKGHHLLAERGRAHPAASSQLTKSGKFFQGLRSRLAKVLSELETWRVRAKELAEEQNMAQADGALQLTFREWTQEEMDAQTLNMIKL